MDDSILQHCNETELLAMAQRQGLGIIKKGLPFATLIGLVSGELAMQSSYLSGTKGTRAILEKFVFQEFGRARSQLPGCTGYCTTYKCSDARHAICFLPNTERVQ